MIRARKLRKYSNDQTVRLMESYGKNSHDQKSQLTLRLTTGPPTTLDRGLPNRSCFLFIFCTYRLEFVFACNNQDISLFHAERTWCVLFGVDSWDRCSSVGSFDCVSRQTWLTRWVICWHQHTKQYIYIYIYIYNWPSVLSQHTLPSFRVLWIWFLCFFFFFLCLFFFLSVLAHLSLPFWSIMASSSTVRCQTSTTRKRLLEIVLNAWGSEPHGHRAI